MKALIVGITGQDGAYLARLLINKGYDVCGVSPQHSSMNYWRLKDIGLISDTGNHPNLELMTMDVTSSSSVESIITMENGFDEVYNLAAQSFVPESFDSPEATLRINTLGVLNIMESILRSTPDTRLYQASTSEMFGLVNVDSQDESTPFHPRSPYAVSKAAAHYLVQNYREAHGLFGCCGILFNHESPYRGIDFVTRKVTDGVARIVTGKTDYLYMGNMEASRDWGHAEDYVYGMWLMLQQDKPDDFVLATGVSHTVEYMTKIAFEFAGMDYKDYVKEDERYMRPSDVPILCGNPAKAERELGWKVTRPFDDLIQEMVHADLYRHGYDPIQAVSDGLRSY